MRTLKIAASLFSLVSFGACVGGLSGSGTTPPADDDGSNDPNATAADYFNANVQPITAARCSTCHTTGSPNGNVTGFVDPNKPTAYATITGFVAVVGNFSSATAPILTKIAAGHESITYTSDEVTKITTWLDKDFAERNPMGAPTGSGGSGGSGAETAAQTTKRVLGAYSGCMTRTNFDNANMAGGVGGWQTTNNQECDNCHATGAEGFIASRAVGTGADVFYQAITTHSSYLQQYFIVDMSMGQAMAKVIMNRLSFDGVSNRQAPHVEHPRFDSTDNGQGIQAISQFYTLTTANTACVASTLVD